MMGVVLIGLADFVKRKKGKEASEKIFQDAGLKASNIQEQRIYPEETFREVFNNAAGVLEIEPHELQIEWGRHMAKMLHDKFPAFFGGAKTAKELLEMVPDIHFKVFPTIIGQQTQKIHIKESGKDYIIFDYTSPNKLCTFMKAMIDEALKRYDEEASIVETRCVRNNEPSCELKVVFR